MRVALVTDWVYGGGSEMVVESFHNLYPDAPIYTSYCSSEWRNRLHNKVVTGYLQNSPFRQLRKFLPLLRQWWFASLDLSGYDLVISITGNGEAKFVRAPDGIHISYCHTPVHFYWRHYRSYLEQPGFRPVWLARLGLRCLVGPLRRRDYSAAQKVDHFIANSSHIQDDIRTYYSRDSVVIHPAIDVDAFTHTAQMKRHGFVLWGRHVPMKRIDIAIEACNTLEIPLTIAGSGPSTEELKKIAGPTIQFVGRIDQPELMKLAASAEGFIFPSYEDFGIAPVEALAAGTPVIAYRAGGALDYVIQNKTGVFFEKQDAKSLADVLKVFESSSFDPSKLKKQAYNFSRVSFDKKIRNYINKVLPES